MNKALQDKLFKKYPKIFRQKDLPMKETAMCWGLGCGDGWYDLVDALCKQIQNRVNDISKDIEIKFAARPSSIVPVPTEEFICEAVQVKSKWGSLRFYVVGGDDFIRGAISLAEALSFKICSSCGKKTEGINRLSLCLECQDKFPFLNRGKNESR